MLRRSVCCSDPTMSRYRQSRSAESVAFVRALYSLPDSTPQLDDNLADRFLSRPLRFAFRLVARRRSFRRLCMGVLHSVLGDSRLYIPLRTIYIDGAVQRAAAVPQTQLLILGAGYDCRALRLGNAFRCCLEIDLAETQLRKREVLAGNPALADGQVQLVAADLRQPDWPLQATAQGLRPEFPTLVVAEGLLGYVSRAEAHALFQRLHALVRASTGCRVVFTYPSSSTDPDRPPAFIRLLHWLFRGSRERFRGSWTPAEMADMLARNSFQIDEDLSFRDLFRSFTGIGEPVERWPLPFRTATASLRNEQGA